MNSLVSYGSDSDEEVEGEGEEDSQQQQQGGHPNTAAMGRRQQQQRAVQDEEETSLSSSSSFPQRAQQVHLVEPRPPRRQSDLFEEDTDETPNERRRGSGGGDRSDEEGEEVGGEADEEEEEELLLRSGQGLAKFLMANQSAGGASTPGGAGYTPRDSGLEDGELLAPMELEDGEEEQMPNTRGMPQSPPGQCSPTLQRKFEQFFERKSAGWDPNAMIKRRRDFKNPSCYEALVETFGIDEKGTNFPAAVFDPDAFNPDDFYDALGDHQALMEAKRKRHQQQAGEQAARRPASFPATSSAKPAEGAGEKPQQQMAGGRRPRVEEEGPK